MAKYSHRLRDKNIPRDICLRGCHQPICTIENKKPKACAVASRFASPFNTRKQLASYLSNKQNPQRLTPLGIGNPATKQTKDSCLRGSFSLRVAVWYKKATRFIPFRQTKSPETSAPGDRKTNNKTTQRLRLTRNLPVSRRRLLQESYSFHTYPTNKIPRD